jgi:hypothetical protein
MWFELPGEDRNPSPIPGWQPQTFHALYRLGYPESESRAFYYEIMADLGLCLELCFPLLQNEMALASDVLIHAMVKHNMHPNRKDCLHYESVSDTSTGIPNRHLYKVCPPQARARRGTPCQDCAHALCNFHFRYSSSSSSSASSSYLLLLLIYVQY